MDKNSLIDFNNDNCYKISSPLIPAPASRSSTPRLSDIYNNPFDEVLRTITNKDDPFECNANISANNKIKITIENENKENIEKLVSPIKTPVKSKKYKRLSTSPLYISKNSAEEVKDSSFNQLPSITEVHNLSADCNTDTSLQILSDSIINNIDDDFSSAYDLPLPDSPDDNINSISSNITNNKLLTNIPSVIIQDESNELIDGTSYTTCSALNNAFIANLSTEQLRSRLSTRSSIASKDSFNVNSFHVESLGTSDISNVLPSVSSVSSKDNENENPLDKAFIKDSSSEVKYIGPLRCLSAQKSTNHVMSVRAANLNNSFAGFNYNDRHFKYGKDRFSVADEDSVFYHLAEVSRTCAILGELNDADISQCSPPWEEEDVVFVDDEDEDKSNENDDKIESTQSNVIGNNNIGNKVPKLQIELDNKIEDTGKCNNTVTKPVLQVASNNEIDDNIKCNCKVTKAKLETDKESFGSAQNGNEQEKFKVVQNNETNTDSTGVKNAQDIFHNLKAMLNKGANTDDQKKLGETLLNSFALALNIESPVARSSTDNSKPINKLQRSKSDSKVSVKSRISMGKQENKLKVPKMKSQPTVPVKHEKNLKVRNEKERVSSRGPLKALIPITSMANIESIAPKINLLNTTPPKQKSHSLLQIKKTSTPNNPKLKPPIAQSTPEISQKQGADINTGTPLAKRHFGFSISPLTRPQSTSDISNGLLNHSLSPRNTSGSAPTLNKSGSNVSKSISNSSIPTIKNLSRRNSVSDMTTSKSTNLNRSYENNKPVRPTVQLKRSSSFQTKSTSALTLQKTSKIDNNNTVKRYGIPGALKSLKLVPKARNVAD